MNEAIEAGDSELVLSIVPDLLTEVRELREHITELKSAVELKNTKNSNLTRDLQNVQRNLTRVSRDNSYLKQQLHNSHRGARGPVMVPYPPVPMGHSPGMPPYPPPYHPHAIPPPPPSRGRGHPPFVGTVPRGGFAPYPAPRGRAGPRKM